MIRFTCGDFEPLAGIVINPPAETEDIDREIKIDTHLAGLGVKLSKADALARYGRTEAVGDDDALQPASNGPQNGLQPGFNGLPNEERNKTPFKTHDNPFKIHRSVSDGQGDGSGLQEPLGAFSRDLGPAAEELKKLLDDLDAGKDIAAAAAALAEKLPELMPDDPAMAAVLAEEMARAFGEVKPKGEGEGLANSITNPCPKCHHQRTKDNVCTHCEMVANHTKGKAALDKALESKGDVLDAMSRKSIGSIDFLWGTIGTSKNNFHDGEGISHILHNHPGDLQQMTGVAAFGDVYEYSDKYYIVRGRRFVSLRKRAGKNSYVITGFEADNPNYTKEIRDGGNLIEKGE